MKTFIILSKHDNVATALQDMAKYTILDINDVDVTLSSDIKFEHKFDIHQIYEGETVIKYGVPIGVAYKNINMGEHVHMHNLRSLKVDQPSDNVDKDWSSRNN